jgi:hypothetical protein
MPFLSRSAISSCHLHRDIDVTKVDDVADENPAEKDIGGRWVLLSLDGTMDVVLCIVVVLPKVVVVVVVVPPCK